MVDKTKYEREKYKKLVDELKSRRSKGKKNLIIGNGNIIVSTLRFRVSVINNLIMGQVNHPSVPDTPSYDISIDKKQKDYK